MKLNVQPDPKKSIALLKMAEITLERLEKTHLESYPSNTLVDYYDILHKLMEALTLNTGIKFKGEGAHQELIEFVAKVHQLGEQSRQLLQQMGEYRNRISYDGFMVHKNYITLNKENILTIIATLKDKLGLR